MNEGKEVRTSKRAFESSRAPVLSGETLSSFLTQLIGSDDEIALVKGLWLMINSSLNPELRKGGACCDGRESGA